MTGSLDLDVSRETLEKLRAFSDLVQKWTKKINLISRQDGNHIWERHVADSAQVFSCAPSSGHWVDLGSGGGFPGIVAAIISQGVGSPHQFTLVESDQRKCVFLRTVVRELDLVASIKAKRIEEIEPLQADIVSARALADLSVLLKYAKRHLTPDGTAVFMKGSRWKKEDVSARIQWSYSLEPIKSKTNAEAAVLKIKDIARV